MQSPPTSFYARWRAHHRATPALHDAITVPPEKLLQAIWQHQRLRRDQLTTLDGQSVRVLHPGFGSVEGGPDFRGAVVRFDDAAPVSGDIEVDLFDSGWRGHGHHQNPAFKHVILHVVWEGRASATRPPTLALRDVLDASLTELQLQLEHNSIRALPETSLGKCCRALRTLEPAALPEFLGDAARVRLQDKAARFRTRAQHVGWEQSLWEGLFRALGYKHNVWPMQHLAEIRARWLAGANSPLKIQSRLLGLSGLLPTELSRTQASADEYLRRVWDDWWREREAFSDCVLPRSVWRFHGLRPANHPQRRLALAAHWAGDPALLERIESWSLQSVADRLLLGSLRQILAVASDDFWLWHWTLRSARLAKPQPLLGEKRVTDLAMNVILPWLHALASAGCNAALCGEVERRYHAWPAAEDNSVLRLARQRLLGRGVGGRTGLTTAATQQGLLQIVRDFCEHTLATCEGCRFPELVRQWQTERAILAAP